MNKYSLPVIALLTAVAAVVLIPVSASGAAIALTATGLLGTLTLDYGRSPALQLAPVVPFGPSASGHGELRRAA